MFGRQFARHGTDRTTALAMKCSARTTDPQAHRSLVAGMWLVACTTEELCRTQRCPLPAGATLPGPARRGRLAPNLHCEAMKTGLALFILAAALGAPAAHAGAAQGATPSDVTRSFYVAYVAEFRSDHNPLLDLLLEGSASVSPTLLTELRARFDDDADPDDDYFLHSPHGVRPCHSVEVELRRASTDDASVVVTMGARHTPPWQLAVSLVREVGEWRIRKVTPSHGRASRKAAARAVSDC